MTMEVSDWINGVVGADTTPSSVFDDMQSGHLLCQLVGALRSKPVKCHATAEPGTFYARDNVSKFLRIARKIGVDPAICFDTSGLVDRQNDKQVRLAFLAQPNVARKSRYLLAACNTL